MLVKCLRNPFLTVQDHFVAMNLQIETLHSRLRQPPRSLSTPTPKSTVRLRELLYSYNGCPEATELRIGPHTITIKVYVHVNAHILPYPHI